MNRFELLERRAKNAALYLLTPQACGAKPEEWERLKAVFEDNLAELRGAHLEARSVPVTR